MTLGDAVTECPALITGPGHNVMLDLVLPPLDPEIAPHATAGGYPWDVVLESDCQPALRSIVGARSASKPVMWAPLVMARLVREPSEFPTGRVEIAKTPVGYLRRGVARQYCALDNAPHEVPATIFRGGEGGVFSAEWATTASG